ncbi:uncharacterized protein LOC128735954 [Sabethes cyaneus]|uniref:uncharacterized protein LOC128735954 n=1 Tax=Sabethes cyaneus TaxID=53552 RepID=UPI00237D8612|nr:uncharacterized protein LOC128735954 [Sabethes cyaneus]
MPRKTRTQDAVADVTLQQSCPLCQLPDCDEMVCCDDCERWYHFECVGVNEDVANYDWSCPECVAAKVPAPPSPHPITPTGELVPHSEPLRPIQRLPSPTPMMPVSAPQLRSPRPPVTQPNAVSQEVDVDPDLVSKLPVQLRIQMLEEEAAIERKFLRRKYQLLFESSENNNHASQCNSSANIRESNSVRDPPVFHSSPMNDHRFNPPLFAPHASYQNRNVSGPVVGTREQQIRVPANVPQSLRNHCNSSAFDPVPTNHRSCIPTRYPPSTGQRACATSFARSQQFEHIPSSSLPNRHQHPHTSAFAPLAGRPRHMAQEHYPYESYDVPPTFGGTTLLNSSQIAARQAIAKELPIFSGDPEEWPLFFATYENSTNLCGYSPEENLARLQKCLRGRALEAVKCQLLHPTNLEQVLSTLEMLFGRPEIIVHSLLQKINALPSPREEHLGSLVDFALAVRNMVATIKVCELEEHLCNLTLLHDLTKRLPPMVRLNWATHRQSLRSVTVSDFSGWLYKLAEAASAVTLPDFSCSYDSKSRRGRKDDGFLNAHAETEQAFEHHEVSSCFICHRDCVAVEKCKKFLSSGLSDRWDILRKYKLCRSCLSNHRGPCQSGKLCGQNGCQYKHHRLMHNDAKDKFETSSQGPKQQTGTLQHTIADSSREAKPCNTHRGGSKPVLFQYVPVTLYSNGAKVNTYAFLDSGSSLTLMEEDLAKELNLRGEKHPLCLRWTADTCRYEKDATRVSLDISGTYHGCPKNSLTDVYTVKELKLPLQSLSMRKLADKYGYLNGLPIHSYDDVQPKLLIGMNNVHLVHALDSREGRQNEPVAVKTRLGWTIYGTCAPESTHAASCSYICFHYGDPEELLHETVKQYFTLDSLGIGARQNQLLSKEAEQALIKLRSTTMFLNGRYQVGLLWKYDDMRLPNNRSMALRRHHCLTKRLERDPELSKIVRSKMADYEHKGYIRKHTPEETRKTGDRTWYLPIFPVFNPNKPGKVRIVFDAAASFGGVSLNSVLMKGPDQLNDLLPVLYKFRERLVGLGGDVAEMFHQIRMKPKDEDSQRIVWCANEETMEPCDYVMQVVTFGATCSPSTAIFVLNENASRFAKEYPTAVDAIHHRHYVDDMLTSVDTEEEAITLANEVRYIHQQGGFYMRNWVSNSSVVLKSLDENPKHEKSMDMNSDLAMAKVLGMWWSTTEDVFRYKLCTDRNKDLLSGGKHPTKRDILRTLMAIYDPLGLIAHYLMYLKVLIQEVWRTKTGWDEKVEERELDKWHTWLHILPELESVEIPRCYCRPELSIAETNIELHTFVDASELGFSQFVAFRVGEILEATEVTEWRWLSSKVNVADDGTKWKNKPDLSSTSRWFQGPPFLWKSKEEWPESLLNVTETVEEVRPSMLHHTEGTIRTILLPQNFSSWYRLRRATAFVLRFVNNIRLRKHGQHPFIGPLSRQELLEAELFQIKRAQEEVYADELAILAAGVRRLHKKNSLFKLSPFIDVQGVLRINSRLSECDFLHENNKYPIVLPRDHPVTILVRDVHLRFHHQCHETGVNEVRKDYHIPRVRRVYDRVRRECQVCKLQRVAPVPPVMASLPKYRLAAFIRPFSYVGVDFFGPMLVVVGRHHEKRWGVIITCLTTRAIHLELAASLNTSSCIFALRNCFARRGTPIEIVSDRGTNFVGADKELKEAVVTLDQDKLMKEFTTPRTSWRFNPPAAPHMGGCWERLIQSVKKILAKVKPQRVPTEEMLRSYLIEVENIINSRPLTHVPVDDCSSPALTPNDILLGSSDGSKPLVQYNECPLALQRSWQASQALANLFWKRWITEYLPTLTRRTKWFYPVRPIAVGEIVIIVDPSLPKNCWPKGRVVSV